MPDKIIETKNGQTVYDIALQYYGSVEHIDKVLEDDNVTSLTQVLTAGTRLFLRDVEDNSINEFFKTRRAIATCHLGDNALTGDGGGFLTGDGGQILFGDL